MYGPIYKTCISTRTLKQSSIESIDLLIRVHYSELEIKRGTEEAEM